MFRPVNGVLRGLRHGCAPPSRGTCGADGHGTAVERRLPCRRPCFIVSVRSGKALDASGGATANGTPIIQWTYTGGTNQQWRLTRNSAGYYTITGVGSGKALDIPYATTWPGTQLHLWTPTGQPNQQWVIAPSDNGNYTIESRSNAYLVDVSANSTADGAAITQWPATGGSNHRWQLIPVA
jgi:hypothetical protein